MRARGRRLHADRAARRHDRSACSCCSAGSRSSTRRCASRARTQARVDTAQRARTAMEVFTRDLRSQVCLSATAPSLTTATTTKVIYYANLGRRRLEPRAARDLAGERRHRHAPLGRHRHAADDDLAGDADEHAHRPRERRDLRRHPVPALLRVAERQPGASDDAAARAAVRREPRAAGQDRPVLPGIPGRATSATTRGYTDMQDALFVRAADPIDTTKGPRC